MGRQIHPPRHASRLPTVITVACTVTAQQPKSPAFLVHVFNDAIQQRAETPGLAEFLPAMDIADAATCKFSRADFHLAWNQFNAGCHFAVDERKPPVAHRFGRRIDHVRKQMLKTQMTRVVLSKALDDMVQHDVVI